MLVDDIDVQPVMNLSPDEWRRVVIIENFGGLGEWCSDPDWWFEWLKNGTSVKSTKPKLRPVS